MKKDQEDFLKNHEYKMEHDPAYGKSVKKVQYSSKQTEKQEKLQKLKIKLVLIHSSASTMVRSVKVNWCALWTEA